jgi:hypothetical protein
MHEEMSMEKSLSIEVGLRTDSYQLLHPDQVKETLPLMSHEVKGYDSVGIKRKAGQR